MAGEIVDRPLQPRTSLWAVVALLSGISIWCPVTVVAAPLLGLRALVEIKAHPGMRGRGLALTGIWLGVVAICVWITGFVLWHIHARKPMLYGPIEAIRTGQLGDIESFKQQFAQRGEAAADAQAVTFIEELTDRYGRVLVAVQDADAASGSGSPQQQVPQSTAIRIDYQVRFERGTRKVETAFRTFGEPKWGLVPNLVFDWDWIRIIDPERGDLAYPSPPADAQTAGQ